MEYLKFTYVDAVTGVSIAAEPALNGTQFPAVPGLVFVWARESAYPTDVPHFFGTCPDGSDTQANGVLGVFTEADWQQMQLDEMRARAPQTVSMRQARLALLAAGKLADVHAAITAMTGAPGEAARIEWEFSSEVKRSQPLVLTLGAALALTNVQLDALFVAAAAL